MLNLITFLQSHSSNAGQQNLPEFECDPVDNCQSSVLGEKVKLTDEFKLNYEKWLHHEIYNMYSARFRRLKN